MSLRVPAVVVLTALLASAAAHAQSICSSDGQASPRAVRERFLSAQCADCWAAAGSSVPAGTVALDWIVPSAEQADEAALSAAAIRDSLERLPPWGLTEEAVRQNTTAALERDHPPASRQGRLRVAQGRAVNDYIGTSVQWQTPRRQTGQSLWLLLVEALPAGTEGSPVARLLVRNSLNLALPQPGKKPWKELRAMRIPEGANPERLQLLGWVQDARGRMLAISETICENAPESGAGR
ncbi:MAG: hypothetical protein EKK45_23790 [Curvibacter sp.]|nr:MAG: hypothetical protein EKK45_23790 [Curvibacter sp.]